MNHQAKQPEEPTGKAVGSPDFLETTFDVPEAGFLQHCGARLTMEEDVRSTR